MAAPAKVPPVLLVTGSSGFIASHLVEHIAARHPDWCIVALDRLDYYSCDAHETLPANCTFVQGDLCDGALMLKLFAEHRITMVAHLAAQTSVDRSFGNVAAFIRDNVLGTQTLLDAIRYCGRPIRLLHMSTDEVYGSITEMVDETAPLHPTNPYAATKAGAELLIRAHRTCFGLDVVMARCNNIYGANQHHEKLIPRFLRLLAAGDKCTLHGEGTVKRRFLHVDDACEALYVLLMRGVAGEAYNIGALDVISIRDVTRLLIDAVHGPGAAWDDHVVNVEDRAHNDLDYNCNSDKMCALGWAPKITMAEGIAGLIHLKFGRDPAW